MNCDQLTHSLYLSIILNFSTTITSFSKVSAILPKWYAGSILDMSFAADVSVYMFVLNDNNNDNNSGFI